MPRHPFFSKDGSRRISRSELARRDPSISTHYLDGGQALEDVVIRHDTSRPWDRRQPSPSIILAPPPRAARSQRRRGEMLSSPPSRNSKGRRDESVKGWLIVLAYRACFQRSIIPRCWPLIAVISAHLSLGIARIRIAPTYRSTTTLGVYLCVLVYVCMFYIYTYIYARWGTVQLNHSLMDRPVNLW